MTERVVSESIPPRIRSSALLRPVGIIFMLFLLSAFGGFFIDRIIFFATFAFTILVLAGFLATPMYEPKSAGSYIERLKKGVEKHNANLRDVRNPSWLSQRLGNAPLIVIIVFMTAIATGYLIGWNDGKFEFEYFVSAAEPDNVLVARYGDILVFRKKASPAITIHVIGKDTIPPLISEHTGSMAIQTKLFKNRNLLH